MRQSNYYIINGLKAFIIAVFTFFTPIKGLIFLVGFCVFIDTIFAIYTTIKINGLKSYQSDRLFNVVVKSCFYLGSIILAFLIDNFIIEEHVIFGVRFLTVKIVSLFWVYIELKSIDETSQKLGNEPFYIILKKLIAKAKSLKKDINELKNNEP